MEQFNDIEPTELPDTIGDSYTVKVKVAAKSEGMGQILLRWGHSTPGYMLYLDVAECRALRDWLNKALPETVSEVQK